MGLFRKNPTFKTVDIGLGSTRPAYLKPTKKELAEIQGAGRLSMTPHGVAPRKKAKRSRTLVEAGELAEEFRNYKGKSASDFTMGFASMYDSKAHLDRNLSFRL